MHFIKSKANSEYKMYRTVVEKQVRRFKRCNTGIPFSLLFFVQCIRESSRTAHLSLTEPYFLLTALKKIV